MTHLAFVDRGSDRHNFFAYSDQPFTEENFNYSNRVKVSHVYLPSNAYIIYKDYFTDNEMYMRLTRSKYCSGAWAGSNGNGCSAKVVPVQNLERFNKYILCHIISFLKYDDRF